MKKNKAMRLASALLVLTLLTTCAISSTFAKYTSTATSSDAATVAKWSFKVGETEIANGDPQTIAFDLFQTVNDTDGTHAETDIAATGKLIAPGTSGSFKLTVQNEAQVTAKYTITLKETNEGNIPLQYSLDGDTWADSIADLTTTAMEEQTLNIGANEVSHTVYWRWAFDGTGAHAGQDDASDTALGIAAQNTAPIVTIQATVTATQVD